MFLTIEKKISIVKLILLDFVLDMADSSLIIGFRVGQLEFYGFFRRFLGTAEAGGGGDDRNGCEIA